MMLVRGLRYGAFVAGLELQIGVSYLRLSVSICGCIGNQFKRLDHGLVARS